MPSIRSFSPEEPDRAGVFFVGVSLVIAAATGFAGLATDARLAVDAALASVAVFAFLPLLLLIGSLLLGLATALVVVVVAAFAAMAGDPAAIEALGLGIDGAAGTAEALGASARFLPWYYRVLARIRHPFFWAIPSGLCLGGLTLAAILAFHVWPAEARTAETMLSARDHIDRERARTGKFPAPGPGQALPGDWRDGFGRPLVYESDGEGRHATWRLRSFGFDGRPGRDDLCVDGRVKVGVLGAIAGWIADKVAGKRADGGKKLAAVRALKCAD